MRNLCLLFSIALTSQVFAAGPQSAQRVDFATEVWPILRENCIQCHGPEKQDGALRLDSIHGVQQGGTSGRNLLHGEQELLRRISLPTNDDQHMPLGGPSLTDQQIGLIRQWAEQGGSWSAATGAEVNATSFSSPIEGLTSWLGSTTRHLKPFFVIALVLGLVVLMLERRRKKLIALGHGTKILRSHYLLAFLGLTVVAQWQHHRATHKDNQVRISELKSRLLTLADPRVQAGGDEFGPVPRRPEHPPRLGGEYYRGNDERHERLFNRGFYRTATFRVFLKTESGEKLDYGSEWPKGPVYLDFELQRSPGTTAGHYTDHSMSSIFLSRQANNALATDVPVPLNETKPKWEWHARYKLAEEPIEHLRGRVFVHCSASVENNIVRGAIHYAISYDINIADGKITRDSEVWMGSLFQTENVVAPPLDKIPVDEWFDFRPIPEVVGENTDDPKLLGLEKPDG